MRPFLAALAVTAFFASYLPAVEPHPDDAPLRAVQFVDKNEGWAVGDEGVVWHTIDGGRNWEFQPTGTRASLRGMHFLTPFTGWIVGREELPTGSSAGVVLFTNDGGLKWHPMTQNVLPGLNCVKFFNDKEGIVAGDGSEQFPSGVYITANGGKSWKSVPGPRCPSWLAADFADKDSGALAGAWSRLATIQNGGLGTADIDTLGGRSLQGLQLYGKRGVAVGQGGVVLTSATSAGKTWGYAELKLPREILSCLDLHGVAIMSDHIWSVGRPGSVVLHSADKGQKWELQTTGQAMPLHGLSFIDEKQGWAVGELGTIMATNDGGKSWTVQKKGGQRAAVLFIHSLPGAVPLEALPELGGNDGYLAAVVRVMATDPMPLPRKTGDARKDEAEEICRQLQEPYNRCTEDQRLNASVRMAGGAAGECLWQFPLSQHQLNADYKAMLASWAKLHGAKPAEQLLCQLVLALRVWRPDVIVTDEIPKDENGPSALSGLLAEAVLEAYKRAEDPEAFPEQIQKLGLKPWKVSKLYARCTERKDAQVIMDTTQDLPQLKTAPRDYAATSAGILNDGRRTLPGQSAYKLVASRIENAESHKSLMQGITLAHSGTARRAQPLTTETAPENDKVVKTLRTLQTLTETPATALVKPDQILASVGPALGALPEHKGAPAAFAIGSQFARTGQWTMAREVFLMMLERYPTHPLSADACRWLIRYSSSSEARRRQELGQFVIVSQSSVQAVTGPGPSSVGKKSSKKDEPEEKVVGWDVQGGVAPADSQHSYLRAWNPEQVRQWYQGSLELEQRHALFGSLIADDPAVQFCLQSARRNLGKFDEASQWYKKFLVNRPEGPWKQAAAAEMWLVNRAGMPPKPFTNCRQAPAKPFLDGKLDDACWEGMHSMKLRNAVGDTSKEYPTEAWLAYDSEFLYVALRCGHPADRFVKPVTVRKRDEDLSGFDRVSLLLDLDRNYSTYFRLEIDQRGCLCEDCWGDKSWNPKWFVAIRSDKSGWQVEAAIPLVELTGEPLTIGKAWACNLVRTLPGRGVQAWSLPADVEPRPEGMGIMLFAADPQRPGPQAAQPAPPKMMPPSAN